MIETKERPEKVILAAVSDKDADSAILSLQELEALAEIQSRFSPELGRLAAQYMSAVTGGRYEDVLLNRDFTASTRTRGPISGAASWKS